MAAQMTAAQNNSRWVALRKGAAPVGAAIVLLLLLNYGLYGRLTSAVAVTPYQLPYQQDFSSVDIQSWSTFDGNWQIADGKLLQDENPVDSASIYIPFSVSERDFYTTQVHLNLQQAGAGLTFNAQFPGLNQNRHVVQLVPRNKRWGLVYGYFQKTDSIHEQGAIPLDIASDQPMIARLAVTVNADGYALSLDDKLLVSNIPLIHKGGVIGLTTSGGAAQFDDFSVTTVDGDIPTIPTAQTEDQPISSIDTAVESNPLLYSSQFTGTLTESGWIPFSGDWALQDGQLIQRQPEGFDLGIVNDKPFKNYQLAVQLRHEEGHSAGLLFNLPQRDRKNGGHMVRYSDDGTGIFWGYFDSQGAFNGQGFATTAPPNQDTHTLSIRSGADAYSIFLDGQTVVENMPLMSSQGFIGLTTSQSTAAYTQVTVNDLETVATSNLAATPASAPSVDLLANSRTVSGEWVRNQDTIEQIQTDAADYITGIGVLAEQYVIEADITLPTDVADAGGGVIFHMPARDSLPGAYMIRFGNGGKIVFWGHYDNQGIFTGLGSVDVNLEAGVPNHLTVIVKTDTFDIQVNNKTIAADLPLEQKSGWLGLISFRGPIVFSDLRLTLGESQS